MDQWQRLNRIRPIIRILIGIGPRTRWFPGMNG